MSVKEHIIMTPDIQDECSVTPVSGKEVEEVKREMEKELFFSEDAILPILLPSIVRAVIDESNVRLAEEMVSFRRSIVERMLNCPEHKMNDTVNLLKLDESFRAGWNKWF